MENPKFISVIIPVYNEERYIDGCVQSMLEQDYPKESMEWIFVDGMSKDATKRILTEYQSRYPALIRVLDNPDKTVPYAMNAGIRAAKGAYIIRLDAHAEYAQDYFSKCVELLERTGADNGSGHCKDALLQIRGGRCPVSHQWKRRICGYGSLWRIPPGDL